MTKSGKKEKKVLEMGGTGIYRRRMLITSIFSFSHNVFNFFENRLQFLSDIYFAACKYFNLDQSKILEFVKSKGRVKEL